MSKLMLPKRLKMISPNTLIPKKLAAYETAIRWGLKAAA
jgi:hypothetical protein